MQNQGLSIFAGVLSLLGAALLVLFLINPFSSAAFFGAAGLGAVGALVGFLAGRSGANTWNRIGLILGLLVVVACALLFANLSVGSVEVTEVK